MSGSETHGSCGSACPSSVDSGQRSPKITDIARRSFNYLTRIAPEDEGYIPFFGGKVPWQGTPYLTHAPWDFGDGIGRILEALSFARRMVPSDEGMDILERLIEKLCSFYEDDGVTYRQPTPWNPHVTGSFELRSSTLALVALIEDGWDSLRPQLEAAVSGLDRVFAEEQLPVACGVWDGERWEGAGPGAGLPVIDALVRAYGVLQSEQALDVALRLIKHYFKSPHALFNDAGEFVFPNPETNQDRRPEELIDYEPTVGHFHTRTAGAVGVARFATAASDSEWMRYARLLHDHILGYGTNFGWFPENLRTDGHEVSELCCTLDMMELQCLLADAGATGLRDLAERFVLNHIAVSQFAPDDDVHANVREGEEVELDPTGCVSHKNVLETLRGGFVCVTYPSEYYTAYPGSRHDAAATRLIDISGCCSGSGAKAAYVAWKNAVVEEKEAVHVHLLVDRSHEALDVRPEACGTRVILTPKTQKAILVRLPEWASADTVAVDSDGRMVHAEEARGYLRIVPSGVHNESITVRFPDTVREESVNVGGVSYSIQWTGNLVRDVRALNEEAPRRHPYTNPLQF